MGILVYLLKSIRLFVYLGLLMYIVIGDPISNKDLLRFIFSGFALGIFHYYARDVFDPEKYKQVKKEKA